MDKFLIRTNESKDAGFKLTNEIVDFLKSRGKIVDIEV